MARKPSTKKSSLSPDSPKFFVDLRVPVPAAAAGETVVGGKAANLARLARLGLPTPAAAVLTTGAWRYFLSSSGIGKDLKKTLALLKQGTEDVEEPGRRARALIQGALMPELLASQIGRFFQELSESGKKRLAVRSSGVSEDSPETSFSGMLSTVLGVANLDETLAAVKKCWSSGFNSRSLKYLARMKLDAGAMAVAVILQQMVEARSSGVLFTVDPATGDKGVAVLEAAFGYGPGVVSGEITPDLYRLDKKTKKIMHWDSRPQQFYYSADGSRREIEPARRKEEKLSEAEVRAIVRYGIKVEKSLAAPQDIEWCKSREEGLVLLQTRPVTGTQKLSLRQQKYTRPEVVIVRGVGASPGVGWGEAVMIDPEKGIVSKNLSNRVAVVRRLTQDLAPHLKGVAAVIADEGGATSHGANILREFQVPCIVGTRYASSVLHGGDMVTVDGWRGLVLDGVGPRVKEAEVGPEQLLGTRTKLMTTINVPETAEKAAMIADGVISFRNDYLLLMGGVHPSRLLKSGRSSVLSRSVFEALRIVSRAFDGKQVWYKTLDAPTDEFRRLRGGEDEPLERNPLLGWRGIRRELDDPALLKAEYEAVRLAIEEGCSNLGVKVPFVRRVQEYEWARQAAQEAGLKPHEDVAFGASIETPAAVLMLDEILAAGVDFISVGVNDLTMCCLGVDRDSERVADYFDPAAPAVIRLLEEVARTARGRAFTAAAGDIAQAPDLMRELVRMRFDAIGIALPYLGTARAQVARMEEGGKKDLINRHS